ncbi:unnamed protein product [Hymenolepis diminuta]|uniref:Uncharacterized protein n=1 Tax=Hymenolepis diminuta TaxID=6216 RepID=A0A564Z3E5_HYMDI|nr:unnamed protein product [Hymenolepis diminuta]
MKRLGWESLKPPHDLSEMNKQQRVTCCVSLRSHELQVPFSDRIITDSDEKWILCNIIKHKRRWLSQDSSLKPIPQPRQFETVPETNSFVCMVRFEGNCLLGTNG